MACAHSSEHHVPILERALLVTEHLRQHPRGLTVISLAECMAEALKKEGMDEQALVDAESQAGLESTASAARARRVSSS